MKKIIEFLKNKKVIFCFFCLPIALTSCLFGWYGIFFLIFSLFAGAVLIFLPDKKNEKKVAISKYFLAIPIAIFIISRWLPFMLYGPNPLGYDTGFYKYSIVKDRADVLGPIHLSETESSGERLVIKSLLLIGASDSVILYWFYALMGLLIGVMIYLLARLYFGERAAFFSALFYSLSFVQFLFYWDMFWNNAIALFLILLIFYLLEQGKKQVYFFVVPAVFFVFITHKTSAFLLVLTLILYFLFKKDKVKYWLIPLLAAGGFVVAWFNRATIIYLWQQFSTGFKAYYDFFSLKEGIFISGPQFLISTLLYLPFSFLAFLIFRKKNLILFFSLICTILILAKFVFYKRIFVFLDIGLLVYSGYAFDIFIQKISSQISWKYGKFFVWLFFSLLAICLFFASAAEKPLITAGELEKIEAMKSVRPEIKIFTYNSYYTPWLYGFSGHKVVAPGWGDEGRTFNEWQAFWASDAAGKRKYIDGFHQLLYIYNSDGFPTIKDSECFKKTEEYFYLFNCAKDVEKK